jgi:Glycosyltransferase family 87
MAAERTVVASLYLALLGSTAGTAVAALGARIAGLPTFGPALIGAAGGAGLAWILGRRRLAARLPAELDGWFARRPVLRWVWLVVAVLFVANFARHGLFNADPTRRWAEVFPPMPESGEHQCLSAYVRAGELAAGGTRDLWQPGDYAPGSATHVDGLAGYLGDPYEYPPTFIVVPRAALAATRDYQLIRIAWFGLGALGFFVVYLGLALWLGGTTGATALLLGPLLASALPLTFGLQWGQAHVLVIAAAVAAMLQFARGRDASGGMLLALATATKIFPGLLLVHLAVRRRWRAVIWTLAGLVALVALTALVVGRGPLASFVTDQLPRMSSGKAFAYVEHNPDNHSLYGLAFKLSALGLIDAPRALGATLAWLWTAVALGLAVVGSRRPSDRANDAVLWLGILCLATLRSPFAPAYTAIATLWLLAVAVGARGWPRWLVALAWVLLQGFPPLFGDAGNALVSMPSQAISIGLAIWATAARPCPTSNDG